MSNILVVDDEADIRQIIRLALLSAGHTVDEAENGSAALKKATDISRGQFDLIILDITMPIIDGVEACRRLKRNPATSGIPILMLSAKTTEIEKVLGLEAGADDYLAKPFGIMELLARVKARLRAKNTTFKAVSAVDNANDHAAKMRKFGALRLDFDNHEAFCNQEKIPLSPKEFELLKLLFINPQKTFSRDELMNCIWEMDFISESRVVDQHVKNLRAKLKRFPELKNAVQTIRSLGYRAERL